QQQEQQHPAALGEAMRQVDFQRRIFGFAELRGAFLVLAISDCSWLPSRSCCHAVDKLLPCNTQVVAMRDVQTSYAPAVRESEALSARRHRFSYHFLTARRGVHRA
ncbi:unnamed protein product, partial [Polarella glacialis]